MLIGVLFLMLGTLAAEVSLFGLQVAALAGAVLFGLSALSFVVVAVARRRTTPVAVTAARRPGSIAVRAPSMSR